MKLAFDKLPLSGWYPAHMLKAGREMQRRLKLVDLVVELLDARVPASSRNPAFRELLRGKPVVLVANKADLADPEMTRAWTEWFRRHGESAHFVNARDPSSARRLPDRWQDAVLKVREARGLKRAPNRPLRIMIAGIPNVGKSTLVNQLAASRKAAGGPKPGVTRHTQWIALDGQIEVLDTPGVLWPRIRTKSHELKLALVGTMRDDYVGYELLAEFLWAQLSRHAGRKPWAAYHLAECPESVEEMLEAVGRRRGLLQAGGTVDKERSATIMLKDFRSGKLGRFTLERPEYGPPANSDGTPAV